MRHYLTFAALAAVLFAACGGNNNGMCDPVAQTGCDNGKVCEEVTGAMPACFGPVELQGKVFDMATSAGIGGASVVALDVNGSAQSNVVVTASDGTYTLPIPAERAADGTPVAAQLTLRVDAAGYQSFPGGVRQALPIDTGSAQLMNGAYVVASSVTDVGLVAEPAGTGTGAIKGTVDVPDDHPGILVVAETSAGQGYSAVADRAGAYEIFNLAPGAYTVTAYARDHVYGTASATVAAGAAATADLHLTTDAAGTVSGSVSIVAGGGGSVTSVVMVVESTFDATTGRGTTVPGLRAPDPGMAPNVGGAFSIAGVPPGKYVVLAAFENDGLVRDPDPCISGTDFVHVQVAAGQTVATPTTFKVTGAITLTAPGVDMPELVTAAPTITWNAYPSTASYDVNVFDSFGTQVWTTNVTTTSAPYAGPLDPGAFYQARIVAHKTGGGNCLISQSEDLRGVFYVQ